MATSPKKRREGSRTKIKSVGDHTEFLQRITRTLYYGTRPTAPGLSLPLTELSCAAWSGVYGRGGGGETLRAAGCGGGTLRAAGCARVATGRVSPAALVLALLYLERLPRAYRANTPPEQLFLVSLMVSNKFLQDDGEDDEVPMAEWADAGRMPPAALRRGERDFLRAIDWNVYVSEDEFEHALGSLERHVALRQAARHGFFTYNDLASSSASAATTRAALDLAVYMVTAALAYTASLLALVSSAAVISHTLPALSSPAADLTPVLDTHTLTTNTTLPSLDTDTHHALTCCEDWIKREQMEFALQCVGAGSCTWQHTQLERQLEPWQHAMHAAGSPLRRWLGRLAEYADPPHLPAPPPACLHVPRLSLAAASA